MTADDIIRSSPALAVVQTCCGQRSCREGVCPEVSTAGTEGPVVINRTFSIT